jgi:predicted ABC-type sugar transport system permease subunit
MSILDIVYSSAPTSEVIIPTLEIKHPTAFEPIRICAGFEDHMITLESGQTVLFQGGGIDVSLPSKDTSGQQVLAFAIDNVTGEAQRAIDSALQAGGGVTVTYRTYLHSDLSAPAEPPLVLTMAGGSFEGSVVQIRAAYFDLLNTAWPRDRYTIDFAPGLAFG